MGRRPGRYGVDAPGVLVGLGLSAMVCLGAAAFTFTLGRWLAPVLLATGLALAASTASFVYTTRRGRFAVWAAELDRLRLTGRERALDIGAGRGALLTALAHRLPAGQVVGIDAQLARDPAGQAAARTRHNTALEGVAEATAIVAGDASRLPFPDQVFDLVVSGVVLHSVDDEAERAAAVAEAWRVLRPGGRLLIADVHHCRAYAEVLRELAATDVTVRGLGWRYWYGSPWHATRMVSARKSPW